MPLQNFVDFLPPSVKAAWLNAVDALKFTVFDDANTKALARTALQLDAQLIANGTDAGVAGAAVVTLTGPVTGWARTTGVKVSFVPAAANTGAATLNVNGTGVANIINQEGNPCTGGELSEPLTVSWTGAAWRIIAGSIPPSFARSALETANGVVPVNYSYPVGHAFRFMTFAQITDVASFTGAVDVAAALNQCLLANNKGTVYLPSGRYSISASLQVYNQNIIGAAKEYVTIVPVGDIPTFVNSGIEFITFRINNLNILYNNGVQPTVSAGNSNKIGFYFVPVLGRSPNIYEISDVQVRGAWWGYFDQSGSYGSTIQRFLAWNCQKGFNKTNGTTMHYAECICLNVNEQFNFNHHQGLVMTSCAADGGVIGAANNGSLFDDCAGLVINGWDSENNALSGQDSVLFKFVNSQFEFNGWTGHVNTQAAAGGENTQIFDVSGGAGKFSACRPIFVAGDLVFTGAGSVFTLLARNDAQVTVVGSDMSAATGGAPAARNTMVATGTARIYWKSVTASSGAVGANVFELADQDSGTFTPVLNGFTVVGGPPILTGTYRRSGKIIHASVTINPNGGTVASVAGTSFITGLPTNPVTTDVTYATNAAVANYGVGLLRTDGNAYTPAWAASGVITTVAMSYNIT